MMETTASPLGSDRAAREVSAQKAIRAAGWCSTSAYSGVFSLATLLIPLFGLISLAAGLVALVAGFVGLLRLRLTGSLARRWVDQKTALERVSFKMTRRAHRQALIGIALGLISFVLRALIYA